MGASGDPRKRAVERAKAEAEAAREVLDAVSWSGTLTGKGGSAEIEVLTILDWADDALQRANVMDMRGWAEGALDDDNFAKWCEVRPTIRDATAFIADWEVGTGEDLGESDAS